MHADWACLAQADRGAGAGKLLRRPTEPARLPYLPTRGWQHAMWEVLGDAAASASACVEYPYRIRKVPIEAIHVTGFPSDSVGRARLALFHEVTGSMTLDWIQRAYHLCKVHYGAALSVRERQATPTPSTSMRRPCVTGAPQ